MPLPRFVVLKSDYNEKYLGYVPPEEFKDIDQGVARSRYSFLRFDQDEASTIRTKFEVTPAQSGDGLVHLKSCSNNKYWVRWSTRHYWIVAAADQPEEDRTLWSCTLFKPVYINRNANTVRFIHVQLGHYASLWRIDLPFGSCLFGGSKDPDRDSCDVVKVIDWNSLSTNTSRPGGSGAAVAVDNNYRFGSAVDSDDDNSSLPRSTSNAIASLKGDQFKVKGTIAFIQEDTNQVTITIKIKGLPYEFHALHIKTYGDISRGTDLTGPTFLDLGNFQSDRNGKLQRIKKNKKISLRDEDSILGRAIVLYSKSNPDPGAPLAWGVIGFLNES